MTTATKQKTAMYQQIEKHGNNLNAIFNTGLEPIKLCKKLRTLEMKATRITTDQCNGVAEIGSEAKLCAILTQVKKILFPSPFTNSVELYKAVFINGDPRGYALKIDDEYVRANNLRIHTDWGGYGILAPDYN